MCSIGRLILMRQGSADQGRLYLPTHPFGPSTHNAGKRAACYNHGRIFSMIGTEAPRRRHTREVNPLVSLRSPLPLIAAGVGVTLLVIAAVTLPLRPAPEPAQTANLSDAEALTLVAHEMRSAQSAQRVMTDGQARFDDGTWYVSVGSAHFHFTQRNRIIVAEDPPAIQLEYTPTT